MAGDFDISHLDVIVADDKIMFIEISRAALMGAGVPEENIHSAEDGVEALEKLEALQNGAHDDAPILLVLDVRMPRMGGNQAAKEVQKLHDEGTLRRRPFVVSLSAGHTETSEKDAETGTGHHMSMPKPLQGEALKRTLTGLRKWWSQGNGRPAFGASAGSSKTWDLSKVDIVLADTEPMCRIALSMQFSQAGATKDIQEADEESELVELLEELQDTNQDQPIICVIGVPSWIDQVLQHGFSRRPFLVCGSVAAAIVCPATKRKFDAIMGTTNTNQDDVATCLEEAQTWWSSR